MGANSENASWRTINSTIGVSRLVSFDGKPAALPQQFVFGLMQRCDTTGKILSPNSLNGGDNVELLTGPFAHFIATIDAIDPEQRIWVLMDVMGQRTRMRVTSDQLRLIK